MSHLYRHVKWATIIVLFCFVLVSAQENARLLEPGKPIEGELAGGNSDLYRIPLAAGQFLDVTADQRGIDIVLILIGPDGKQLLEVDSPNGTRGPEPLWFVTETAGDYRIGVRSLEKDAKPGRYEIKINELRAATSDDPSFVAGKQLVAQGLTLGLERKEESRAKALQQFRAAAERFRLIGDKKRKATALRHVSGLYRSLGQSQEAIQILIEVGLLFEEANLKRDAAIAFKDAGDLEESDTKSLQYYEKSLALSEAIGDKDMIARVLGNIGGIYRIQGKAEQALDVLERSLKLANELSDKSITASALTNIGNVYAFQGRGLEAIECYQKSISLYEAMDNKGRLAINLINLGSTQETLGNSADALASFEKSLALSQAIGNKRGMSVVLMNIGNIYMDMGNNIRAMDYYQKSLALSGSSGGKGAGVLLNIGNLYFNQGDYAQAQRNFQKALDLFEADDAYGVVTALINIGEVSAAQGNTTQALDFYQKALTRSEAAEAAGLKDQVASALRHLGKAYRSQRNYTQALDFFQRGLKLSEESGNKRDLADTLRAMAETYLLQQDYSLALEFAERAAGAAQQTDWESSSIAARAYRALNQPDKARQKFQTAIASIEALRSQVVGGEEEQQRFMEGKVLPYQEMIELLVAQGKTEEALAFAERSKGRVLLDVMRSGRVSVSKSMTAQEKAEERRLNNELVSLNTQLTNAGRQPQANQQQLADLRTKLEETRLDYEAFRTRLYAAHPNLKAQRGEMQPVSLQQAFSLLPDDKSALLDYVVSQERTYLFVITKSVAGKASQPMLKVYPIEIGQKELEQRVEAYRQKIARADLDFRPMAQALYDLLLKPAQAQLTNHISLVIVPDGTLWDLPFQALQSSAQRYVIEDQAISYAPSLTVLKEFLQSERTQRSSASTTLLAFGNPVVSSQTAQLVKPVFMDEALEPLPEAEKQVNELAKLYGAQRTRIYTGVAAREDRAKAEAPAFRILQFATHGVLNSTSPMYSHLVLSPGDQGNEDGLLEAWEIMNLDLHADLVVLAACETARGRVSAGEGMIGMSWAFFVAGAPTTVASQWKVESASTTQLMLEFHRNLVAAPKESGRLSKAQALQMASLKLLKSPEYRHPFYWAGFVMIGDGF